MMERHLNTYEEAMEWLDLLDKLKALGLYPNECADKAREVAAVSAVTPLVALRSMYNTVLEFGHI